MGSSVSASGFACFAGSALGSVSIPKHRVALPPGGAERSVVGRSVSTFPEFWCAPQAKALDDTDAVAATSVPRQIVDFPPDQRVQTGTRTHTHTKQRATMPQHDAHLPKPCALVPGGASASRFGISLKSESMPRQIVDLPPVQRLRL